MVVSRAMLDIQCDRVIRLIVLRHGRPGGRGADPDLLAYGLSTAPLNRIALEALSQPPYGVDTRLRLTRRADDAAARNTLWVIPGQWQAALPRTSGRKDSRVEAGGIDPNVLHVIAGHPWLAISDGRFVTRVSRRRLEQGLAGTTADAIAILADPELAAYRERVRLTQQGQLVGYRRLYRDSTEPVPLPSDWPHHLFMKGEAAAAVLEDGLPDEFQTFAQNLRSRGLSLETLAVAGAAIDLATEEGWLSLAAMSLGNAFCCTGHSRSAGEQGETTSVITGDASSPSRLVGPVLLGDHVRLEPGAVVVGPSILCDHSTVRDGAVVDASIVGTGAEVARDQVVRHCLVATQGPAASRPPAVGRRRRRPEYSDSQEAVAFRSWPRCSYAGGLKRVADVIAALVVLVLFAPILPFIAVAIKVNSSGPVFYSDKRQGLHGKPFRCFKFRTMRVGADKLQEKLRFISEVDGPQFKMADDPRITTVGRFLRETYLDEIPQFYNVLMGDMSVVGPRPSPESENTLCPWWRDARLSVRPGITGLWQICRTREPLRDFQEWIHYDTRYVRELSWRLDLWICWRTFKRMVVNFVSQF